MRAESPDRQSWRHWLGTGARLAVCLALSIVVTGVSKSDVGAQTDMQPPSVIATSPNTGAGGVSVNVAARATFSEPVQVGSIVFGLRNPANQVVAGSMTYDANTRTATFTPTAALTGATTFTARVDAALDLAGNALASPVIWTFATAVPGFQESIVFSGLTEPTAIEFSPDGRIFIAEKSGLIKIFDNLTDTTPTIFADLRTNTYNFWDRGLLGLALHPNFPLTPYVYVIYTFDGPIGGTAPTFGIAGATSDTCPTPPGPVHAGCTASGRVSRLQANGNQMVPGSETVLVHDWFQQFPGHSVGDVIFGPDGALYASGGDGASFNYVDYGQTGNPGGDPPSLAGIDLTPPTAEGGSLRSQDILTRSDPLGLNGSLIRIDPDTGAGMPNNPLAADPDANARRMIAHGFRTPFRLANRPGTNEIWVADTGWNEFEEINRVQTGPLENFGWPCFEGPGPQSGFQAAGLNLCQSLYNSPASVVQPYYTYQHFVQAVPADTCGTGSAAISAIAFYTGTKFPASYSGALFFGDYSRNCIWYSACGRGWTAGHDHRRDLPRQRRVTG